MKRGVLAAAALMALVALPAPGPAAAAKKVPTISISGSNTALPLVADLVFFYRRTVKSPPRFNLVGGGTEAGVIDASRGISDIGMATRTRFSDDPANTVFTRFARSALCLVTNKENPVANFTRAQIQGLVSGQITNWSQFGGSPRTDDVMAAGLAEGTGERTAFLRSFVDLATPVTYTQRTLANASQVRTYVEGTPAAWAYVDLAFSPGLNVASYEGVACTRKTVENGTYPGINDANFVTRGKPKGAAKRFIEWTRSSPLATRVINTRYIATR